MPELSVLTGNIPHIVVVGGGIMGSWSTILLTRLARLDLVKVTMVDAGHPIRGSWGDSRALHVAMEDDTRIKMNKINVTEYIKLQRESTDSLLLVQFCIAWRRDSDIKHGLINDPLNCDADLEPQAR